MQEWGHSIIVIDETVKVTKEFLENDSPFIATKNGHKSRSNPDGHTIYALILNEKFIAIYHFMYISSEEVIAPPIT